MFIIKFKLSCIGTTQGDSSLTQGWSCGKKLSELFASVLLIDGWWKAFSVGP